MIDSGGMLPQEKKKMHIVASAAHVKHRNDDEVYNKTTAQNITQSMGFPASVCVGGAVQTP